MVKIYCIEDCNGLKYVGSTKQKLNKRLTQHKCDKKRKNTSSKKLDLDNCKIYVLEETDEEHRIEREKYWIHKIDCVNVMTYDFDEKEYYTEYYQENKDERLEYQKEYQQKNRDEIKQKRIQKYYYRKSWGGDVRSQNNLLLIDIDLFL